MRTFLRAIFSLFGGVLLLAGGCFSENILIFHGISSYSHRVQTWPLAEALAERGHNVSYIAPFYDKKGNPKIAELVPKSMAEFIDKIINSEFDVNLRVRNEMPPLIDHVWGMGTANCEILYSSPEFKQWLEETEKIDLMVIDNALPECGMGLAHKLGSKYVVFNTGASLAHEYDAIGYLPQSSSIPELETIISKMPMGFFERLSNTLLSLRWRYQHYKYTFEMNDILRRLLSIPDMPNVDDLLRNVGLVFSTGNVVTDYPRSLPPLFVDVSGIHLKDSTRPLPKKIEAFVSANNTAENNDGFIYISLGSVVVSSNLPENIKKVFFDVVKAFPDLKFLWKWNGDFPKDIPKNLMLEKWFPQSDVLAHPKIRGFISQCGRPSSLEALYNAVPIIGFPIIGDQDLNAERMSETGAGVKLEIGEVTFEKLCDAVRSVAYDPSVKKRMTKLQTIFRDRPLRPLEAAVWWTEYVLRSEDTAHLQPYGNNQYWFVRRQVDVWAFLTVATLAAATALVVIAKNLQTIFGSRTVQKKKKLQ